MAPLQQSKKQNYRQTLMSATYKNGFRALNVQSLELLKIFLAKIHGASAMEHAVVLHIK
jgi:hypothetical protein